ncbi:MAG: hypothetical protein J2P25_19530 [Nocardiopsaceae bacterium]|nr:hypothetical protein [Nocardiopsaceae bacterium]
MSPRFTMRRRWWRLAATALTLGAGLSPLVVAQLAQASPEPAAAAATSVQACGSGPAVTRPASMILTCADHGEVARNLTWTSWTAKRATATGEVTWRTGGTSLARSTRWGKAAASFTLSGPKADPNAGSGSKTLFTTMTMHVTGATPKGFKRDLAFDESPQPAITPATPPATRAPASSKAVAPAASSGTLNTAAIGGYWELAGGPSSVAETAEAITGAESSFEPGIIQAGQPYSTTGWGLWQITPGDSVPGTFGEDYQLLDPWNNAEGAVNKYDAAGGFSPWTTYDDGAYKNYVKYESAPNTNLSDPGQYDPINGAPSGTHNSSHPGSTYGPPLPGAGTVDLFWKDASNDLEQASGPADGNLVGPVERASMGSNSSNPAVAVQSNGYTYVYWEENGDLWEDYWNGSWSGAVDSGISGVASEPTAAVNSAGTAYVFWKGTNGNLYEASGPAAGKLSGAVDRGMGTLGSAPTVGIDSHSFTYVYWQGTDGHLWETHWDNSTASFTSATSQTGMGTLGSAPSAVVTAGGVAHVFWKGTNGYFYEGSGNADGTLGGPTERSNMGTLGSAPSAGMSEANWPAVYWLGQDGTLWEGYYNGSGWPGPAHRTSVGTLANPPSAAVYGG